MLQLGGAMLQLAHDIREVNLSILALDPADAAYHNIILQLSERRQWLRETYAWYRQAWHTYAAADVASKQHADV